MNDQRLRVGVVGLGFAGRTALEAFSELPDVEVVALAGLEKDILTSLGEKHGVPHLYEKWEDLLETEGLEAVSIGTPTQLHAPIALKALEKGLHVLSEKPLARTVAEGTAMVEASKAAGRVLKVVFNHRERGDVIALKHQIDEGQLGRIYYAKAHWMRRNGIPGMGGWFTNRELSGGGPLIDLGVHILEAAHYIIGAPRPVTATGATYCYIGDKPCQAVAPWGAWDHSTYSVEDLAVGTIRFENGTMLSIESSFAAHIEKDVWNITIMGEKAGASWESATIFTDHGGYMMNMTAQHLGTWDHFEQKMKHFVEVCRDGRKNESPGEHGLMVQKMLDGVYASAEKGREVPIE